MTTIQTEPTTAYAIDGVHSTVEFVVRHLMISKVRGHFTRFEGTLDIAPGSNLPTSANVTIDATSVDTREPQRDTHLKSADFFEVEKYPALTFVSRRVEGTPERFQMHGQLTIHGVTRDVTLDGEFEGRGADPWGGERVGYSAKTTINRKEYGLVWNQTLDAGGLAVSDDVRIELNVEAVRQT